MVLYFLRHGDAVQSPLLHDSERPLSEIGKQQARNVTAFCSRSGIAIDALFCSPLVRAREMAEPLRILFPDAPCTFTEYLVPGARPAQLFDQINGSHAQSAMLIGHEPLLGTLVSLLVTGDTQSKVQIGKAGMACVESTVPVRQGHGVLKWLIPVEHLSH